MSIHCPPSEDLKEPLPEEAQAQRREARGPGAPPGAEGSPWGNKARNKIGIKSTRRHPQRPWPCRCVRQAGQEKRFGHTTICVGLGAGCCRRGVTALFPWKSQDNGASPNTPPAPVGTFPAGADGCEGKGPGGAHGLGQKGRCCGCSGQQVPGTGSGGSRKR